MQYIYNTNKRSSGNKTLRYKIGIFDIIKFKNTFIGVRSGAVDWFVANTKS